MSSDDNSVREAVMDGLEKNGADRSAILSALKQTPVNYLSLVKEEAAFVKELVLTETPSEPDDIHDLSEEEIIFATQRANFFEKIRMPALDDDQLEHLLIRTHQLWGEHPTEPMGRWVDWCLWTHLNRRRNSVPITEVIAGDKTANDLKEAWVKRHQARENRRRLQKVNNYDRYNTPDEVPQSLRRLIMSPFIENPEMADIEIDNDTATTDSTE